MRRDCARNFERAFPAATATKRKCAGSVSIKGFVLLCRSAGIQMLLLKVGSIMRNGSAVSFLRPRNVRVKIARNQTVDQAGQFKLCCVWQILITVVVAGMFRLANMAVFPHKRKVGGKLLRRRGDVRLRAS